MERPERSERGTLPAVATIALLAIFLGDRLIPSLMFGCALCESCGHEQIPPIHRSVIESDVLILGTLSDELEDRKSNPLKSFGSIFMPHWNVF